MAASDSDTAMELVGAAVRDYEETMTVSPCPCALCHQETSAGELSPRSRFGLKPLNINCFIDVRALGRLLTNQPENIIRCLS